MSDFLDRKGRWWVVVIYAVAMAWVEAAVVYYLRTMVDRIDPHQANPLPLVGRLGDAELVREAATLLMLLAVGALAGRNWRGRLGYAALAFGFWDIFYYFFLKILCGWPNSLFDWDVLFLLPLPWWGPVLAPMLISGLMITWGTLVNVEDTPTIKKGADRIAYVLSGLGVLLALYLFMADTLRVSLEGAEAVRNVFPTVFHWAWFSAALVLMSAPAGTTAYRLVVQKRSAQALPISVAAVERHATGRLPGRVPDKAINDPGRAVQRPGL